MALPKLLKNTIRTGIRKAAHVHYALRRHKYRYVFILGHMRSGSTVLSHILNSHPDFVGAGATHTNYETPTDLPKLVSKTCELLRKFKLGASTYIVDQINHPYLSDQVLSSELIYRCIILIRAPEGTLKSLMALFGWSEEIALGCYIGRLDQLSRYGRILGHRAILVQYDDLVDHTQDALAALTQFLAAEPPFESNYNKSKATGKVGDPSKNIFSGSIIRTQGHKKQLSQKVMAEAILAFRNCRLELLLAGVLPSNSQLAGEISCRSLNLIDLPPNEGA